LGVAAAMQHILKKLAILSKRCYRVSAVVQQLTKDIIKSWGAVVMWVLLPEGVVS
jgi:hypothetical protein